MGEIGSYAQAPAPRHPQDFSLDVPYDCQPKAVLENVIFVHQEDSNWPLSEGKVLKDKFDDIFSATKYTKVSVHLNISSTSRSGYPLPHLLPDLKALEALRKLRSEKAADIKEMKAHLETHKAHRDQALRFKKEVSDCQGRTATFQGQIDDLEGQIQV